MTDKYSGQCSHGRPMGKPCEKCGRQNVNAMIDIKEVPALSEMASPTNELFVLKYQLKRWQDVLAKYLPPTDCDRDDPKTILAAIEQRQADLDMLKKLGFVPNEADRREQWALALDAYIERMETRMKSRSGRAHGGLSEAIGWAKEDAAAIRSGKQEIPE